MEDTGASLRQNARDKVEMEVILQGLPCFAEKWRFCVQGGLSGEELVFMAQRVV